MTTKRLTTIALCVAVLLTACGPSSQEAATLTAAAWTPTQPATDTPAPTSTATASPSPRPSDTPTITLTPSITPTLSANVISLGPGDPIRLGYLLAENYDLGTDSRRGIEVAIADAGTELLGHPIELIGFNTQCNKLAAQRGAERLVAGSDVLGVIGTSCSGSAPEAAKVLSAAGIVMLSPSNTDPDLTAPDSHFPSYFRVSPSDLVQARAVARFAAEELGAKRMATISYTSDRYSVHMNAAACQEFAGLGGDCVDERKINRGDTYVTAVLRKIAQTAPHVLYLILSPAEASLILAEGKETAGLEGTAIIVQELSFEPYLLELSGDSAIGVYLSQTSMQYDRSSDAYQTFLLGYRDRFAQEPTTAFHAFGYDAAGMLLNAIQLSAVPQTDGGLVIDREAILANLFATRNFPGLTGSLTCSPTGDCASDALGGIVYLIESGDPSTWNPGVGLTANPVQVWPDE